MRAAAAKPTHQEAEAIAIAAVSFLAEDERRLGRFLDLTGWSLASLRSPDDRTELLSAVLDHLMGDESLLLTFAGNGGIDPGAVASARRLIGAGNGA